MFVIIVISFRESIVSSPELHYQTENVNRSVVQGTFMSHLKWRLYKGIPHRFPNKSSKPISIGHAKLEPQGMRHRSFCDMCMYSIISHFLVVWIAVGFPVIVWIQTFVLIKAANINKLMLWQVNKWQNFISKCNIRVLLNTNPYQFQNYLLFTRHIIVYYDFPHLLI